MVEETKSALPVEEGASSSSRQALNKILGTSDHNFTSQQHSSTAISQGNLTHQTDQATMGTTTTSVA